MKSDADIERDVKEELKWNPDLDEADIAVSVKKGVATLAGFVRSYTDKYEAEATAKRVAGVIGVANDLEVRMPSVVNGQIPSLHEKPWRHSRVSCQSSLRTSRSSSATAG
jgi:hypothetical protein